MGAVWTITRKDLLLRFRDRSILLYGVVAPLAIATVLGLTFSGLDDRVTLDLAVVPDAQGEIAGPFLDEVLPALVEDGLVSEVTEYGDVVAARTAVEEAQHTAAVVFTEGVTGPGDIEVLGNVDSPTGVGVTEAIVESYADGVRSVSLVVAAGMASGAGDPQALVSAARDARSAVTLVEQPVGLVPIDITTYMAAGMSVFFLLFSVGIAITGLLEEERNRTMARLRTAPIPDWAPLAAKGLSAFLIGVGSMVTLAVLTTLLIGAEWGDPVGVGVLIVAAVLAATGLVALVASFTRTPESASGALGVVGTVLGALGGAFFPLRQVGALDAISAATPHHWFLQGLTRLAGGAHVGDVLGPVAVLLVMAVVTAALAVVRFQRTQGGLTMLAFARVAVIRLVRDRTNVFFIVLFPVLIVLLIGMQFGTGGTTRIGVVEGADADLDAALREQLLAAEGSVELHDLPDEQAARAAVEAADVDAAVVLPDQPVDVGGDGTVEVGFIANPDGSDLATRSLVQAAVADIDGPLRAQRALLAADVTDDVDRAAELVDSSTVTGPDTSTSTVGEEGLAAEFSGLGQFDLGASTQLLLFVFLTSITGSAAVVQARRWGVLERVLAGPTPPSAVMAGLGLGQLAVAAVQALVIVAVTTVLFDVNWGDPLASGAVVVLFSMVAAAAGLLLGALLRNEEQAGGVGVPLGLGLGALGGCMVPLELFPAALQTVSRFTPHAWGNLAFAEIVRRDGTLVDVLPELGVLLGFALVLGGVSARTLRRRLTIES